MQICRPAKCIEAIRITLLDQCTYQPVCGPLNGYAMGCIIDPNWTPEIEEGEESTVKDNCGNICLEDRRCDRTKRHNIEFKIKGPDPEFLALISGDPLVINGDGVSIGLRNLAYSCSPYVFLEMFERTDSCGVGGDAIYIRHVFPAVRLKATGNEREGVFRIPQIEGKTKDVLTNSVGTGPYGDIPAGVFVGATASERTDYTWFEDTTLPAVQCGSISVPCPEPLGPLGFASLDGCFPLTETQMAAGLSAVQVVQDALGNYIIAGTAFEGGENRPALWRYLPDGTADPTWAGGSVRTVDVAGTTDQKGYGVMLDTAGNIYLLHGGTNPTPNAYVTKLTSAGVIVGGFATAGTRTFLDRVPTYQGIIADDAVNFFTVAMVDYSTDTGKVFRVDYALGNVADVMDMTASHTPLGIAKISPGNYAVGSYDTSTTDRVISILNLGPQTETDVIQTVVSQDSSRFAIFKDPFGNIYVGGKDPIFNLAAVARFDQFLTLDPGWGGTGVVVVDPGGALAGSIRAINRTAGGDILVSGFTNAGGPTSANSMTALLDSSGVFVPTYGVAGISVLNLADPANPADEFFDAIIDVSGLTSVNVGYRGTASGYCSDIARTDIVTGALDLTFGDPAL